MSDDSEYLVFRMRQIRRAIAALEDGPPHSDSGCQILADLEDYLRDTDTDLRHERATALEEIGRRLQIAGRRLERGVQEDDLAEGVGPSTMDLSSLGTLFGHFDRALHEIPDEWTTE